MKEISLASRKARGLYAIAAILAAVAATLTLAGGDWFRAVTGFALAATMAVAATGYPERSDTNRLVYFGLLGVVSVLLIIQIARRWM